MPQEEGPQLNGIHRLWNKLQDEPAVVIPDIEKSVDQFTEAELLGIDMPRYEIISGEQHSIVPPIVHYIYFNKEKHRALLARFDLKATTYDPKTNPQGLFTEEAMGATARSNTVYWALLKLVGVREEEVRNFYGLNPTRIRPCISPAFNERLAKALVDRDTYVLEHSEEYPHIHYYLGKIKELTGLNPDQFFVPGYVPPLNRWMSKKGSDSVTLEQGLSLIVELLSGTTLPDIAARRNQGYDALRKFIKGPALSEPLRTAVENAWLKGKPSQ